MDDPELAEVESYVRAVLAAIDAGELVATAVWATDLQGAADVTVAP